MKNIIVFLLVGFSLSMQASVNDTVILGPGTRQQCFYTMDGTKKYASNASWDLKFRFKGFSACIRTNDGNGVKVYLPVMNDTSKWSTLDTTGMVLLNNKDNYWDNDAFYLTRVVGDTFDYGWGRYNPVSHNLTGKKLFVLEIPGVGFKKFWIKSLVGGTTYNFTLANLDHSGETNVSINKSFDANANFLYYQVNADSVFSIEPAGNAWDVLFSTYARDEDNYIVVGALGNLGTRFAEAYPVANPETVSYTGYTFTDQMDIIGYDWKTFLPPMGPWVISDSTAYFVQAQTGNIWRVIMKYYGGGSNGMIVFGKELVGMSSINDDLKQNILMEVYPNPATEQLFVSTVSAKDQTAILDIVDITGTTVHSMKHDMITGVNSFNVSLQDLHAGMYFMRVESAEGIAVKKFFVR